MRVDCIFCGFESYGVDGLKAHSATCNLHPLTAERDQLRAQLEVASNNARHYAVKCVESEAQVADLRGALETLNHAAKVAISTQYGGSFDEDTPLVIRLLDGTCDETDAIIDRTPAQSRVRLKAGVLREMAELIGPKYGEGQARWALRSEANDLEATNG